MLFTRIVRTQQKRMQFGNQNLPRMRVLPRDRLFGLSKRQFCWTVIIVTIPFIIVSGNIVYKRLVLGEEKRKTLMEGGMDASFVLDNISSSRNIKFDQYPPPPSDEEGSS